MTGFDTPVRHYGHHLLLSITHLCSYSRKHKNTVAICYKQYPLIGIYCAELLEKIKKKRWVVPFLSQPYLQKEELLSRWMMNTFFRNIG